MSKEKVSSFERKVRLLGLINDGVLPAAALGFGALAVLSSFIPVVGLGIAAGGIMSARQYGKQNKKKLFKELEDFKNDGEISESKYLELKAILNKLTIEGEVKTDN